MKKKYSLSNIIETFTYTNQVSNGNFNDTTSWNASNSTLSVANNILSVTGNGGSAEVQAFQDTGLVPVNGHKLFVSVFAKVTNAVCSNLRIDIRGSTGGNAITNINQLTPSQDTEYNICGIASLTNQTGVIRINPRHIYADAATANGKVLQLQKVFIVNLTTLFGAGNEPSLTDCSNIFKFVDGTKQPSFSKSLLT